MRSRVPLLLTLAGLGAWLAIAVITWAGAAPLGHDESQYALAARDTLDGLDPRWFYLSRGMNAIAIPGVVLGGSEHALRLVPLLVGLGFVIAAYGVARRIGTAASAGWMLCVLAGSNIARLSTDLLSDIPSAACLLAAFAVFVDEVDRETGPRWRVVIAAPLLAAAFYLRYGSIIPIAIMVGATLLIGVRGVLRRPLPVVATAALFLVLLVPHFAQAYALVGEPLGILRLSREVPQEHQGPSGLVTYLTSNPLRFYGLLLPFVAVAGVAAFQLRDRRRLLTWLVAVGSLVALGLISHGVLRYVLVPVALLVVLGTDMLGRWSERLPARARRVVGVVLAVAVMLVAARVAYRQVDTADVRRMRMRGTLAAARTIRADANGAPCIVIGYHSTQLDWYSGCTAPLILSPETAAEGLAQGKRVYVVRDHVKPKWNPELAEMPGTPEVLLAQPDVEVARLRPR